MKQVQNDDIIMATHILWERGWKATPESVGEMLVHGCEIQGAQINTPARWQVLADLAGTREKYLSQFNWDSAFAKQNQSPWPIDHTWKHQEIDHV
jgi:hypothetical protein